MAIPRRGLNSIRTLAGHVDQLRVPYRCYMHITCLEMEKERRGAERRSAMARVDAIDGRLAVIALEKEATLNRIQEGHGSATSPAQSAPAPSRKRGFGRTPPAAGVPSSGTGFRIRY